LSDGLRCARFLSFLFHASFFLRPFKRRFVRCLSVFF
jgi:hypothetical protein